MTETQPYVNVTLSVVGKEVPTSCHPQHNMWNNFLIKDDITQAEIIYGFEWCYVPFISSQQ
jgi:hypothetical protein